MTRLKFLLLGCAFLLLFVTPVAAAPILYKDFCPEQASCPSSVTEASLSFEEVLTGTDPNDYNLRITLTGGATAPAYVDELSFTIGGVGTPSGYETVPVILAFSAGTGRAIVYDNVSASANSCVTSTNNSNEVCLASGPGSATNLGAPMTNNTVTFDVFVNITDTGLILTSQTEVNLRAQFVDAQNKNKGILSPENTQTIPTPEPTSLVLLGTGLVGLARRYRHRKQRTA